jgi:DNA-directed RNA polymerase subunit RPC12/RpoP
MSTTEHAASGDLSMADIIYNNTYTTIPDAHLPDMEVSDRLDAFICGSCGAELLTVPGEDVGSCPFCGSQNILPGRDSAALPDAYIPFNIDTAAAAKLCADYCSSRMMLPASFVRHLSSLPLRRLYVPFWLYSGSSEVDISFRAVGQDKQPVILSCSGKLEYRKLPLPASSGLSDGFLEMLMPYGFSALRPFLADRMGGSTAEAFEEDLSDAGDSGDGVGELIRSIGVEEKQAGSRAVLTLERDIISEQAARIIRDSLPYQVENEISSHAVTVNSVQERIMVPLYYLKTHWHKKDYCFGINGQTGEVHAEFPFNTFQLLRLRFFSFFAALPVVFLLLMLVLLGIPADPELLPIFVMVGAVLSVGVSICYTYLFVMSLQAEGEPKKRMFYTTFFADGKITDRTLTEKPDVHPPSM